MTFANTTQPSFIPLIREYVGQIGFAVLIVSLGLIIYSDDLQLTSKTMKEVASIYNTRIAGLKIVDIISITLTLLLATYIFVEQKFIASRYHRYIGYIFAVYCGAGIIGFIYSFWYQYEYLDWLQDLQPFIYLMGFFLVTFHFTTTKKRWYVLVTSFLVFLAAKNFLILYKSLMGKGISVFFGIIRASQNSEFSYFPMLFFPLVLLLFYKTNVLARTMIFLTIAVYLFNTVMGMVRTVWVVLIVGMAIMMFFSNRKDNFKMATVVFAVIGGFALVLDAMFPLALEYLWSERFMSIVDWKFSGNLSNAIRLVQIVNVWDWVFSNFSFLQGMGLGAWWEESARRMLPNDSSEYHLRAHFRRTDILIVTQLLKIGIIGITIFWFNVYRIVRDAKIQILSLPVDSIDRRILLGILIGIIAAFLTQADFVRLYLMIGVAIAIIAGYFNVTTRANISA